MNVRNRAGLTLLAACFATGAVAEPLPHYLQLSVVEDNTQLVNQGLESGSAGRDFHFSRSFTLHSPSRLSGSPDREAGDDRQAYSWDVDVVADFHVAPEPGKKLLRLEYEIVRTDHLSLERANQLASSRVLPEQPVREHGVALLFPEEVVELRIPQSLALLRVALLADSPATAQEDDRAPYLHQ